jgi:hypothetical protein
MHTQKKRKEKKIHSNQLKVTEANQTIQDLLIYPPLDSACEWSWFVMA